MKTVPDDLFHNILSRNAVCDLYQMDDHLVQVTHSVYSITTVPVFFRRVYLMKHIFPTTNDVGVLKQRLANKNVQKTY